MLRKIAYWGTTGLVGIATLAAGFSYLIAAPEAISFPTPTTTRFDFSH